MPKYERICNVVRLRAGNCGMVDRETVCQVRMLNQQMLRSLNGFAKDYCRLTGCEIRSIILPLLADHVLREANHYLRILEQRSSN